MVKAQKGRVSHSGCTMGKKYWRMTVTVEEMEKGSMLGRTKHTEVANHVYSDSPGKVSELLKQVVEEIMKRKTAQEETF